MTSHSEKIKEKILRGESVTFPIDAPDSEIVVEAEWIVEAIRNSMPAEITNAIISGSLQFDHETLNKDLALVNCRLENRIEIQYCEVKRELNLNACELMNGADFAHSLFTGLVNLNNVRARASGISVLEATFRKGILGSGMEFEETGTFDCANAEFFGPLFMSSCAFNGGIHFFHTTCHRFADFNDSSFNKRIIFLHSEFRGDLKIRNGTFKNIVHFRSSVFNAEIDLSKSDIQDFEFKSNKIQSVAAFIDATFNGPSTFINSVFDNQVNFAGATFGGQHNFNGNKVDHAFTLTKCCFNEDAEFRHNHFGHIVDFSGAKFLNKDKTTDFYGSHFSIDGNFIGTEFHSKLIFQSVFVDRYANFTNARFYGEAIFESMKTMGASFSDTTFETAARFMGASFVAVNFAGAKFKTDADFNLCQFNESVTFEGAVFEGAAYFRHTKFEKRAGLNEVIFEDEVDFSFGSFRNATFSLTGLVEGKEQFAKSVKLTGCTYDHIQVNWKVLIKKLGTVNYRREPFTQLENTLRKQGQEEAADKVYYQRRRIEAQQIRFFKKPFSWIGNRMLWILTGYGVQLERLLYISAIILLCGTFIFSSADSVRPNPEKAKGASAAEQNMQQSSYGYSEAFWFTADLFLPVDLSIGKKWIASENSLFEMPSVRLPVRIQYNVVAALLEIIGWILVPVGIAGLTGLLKR